MLRTADGIVLSALLVLIACSQDATSLTTSARGGVAPGSPEIDSGSGGHAVAGGASTTDSAALPLADSAVAVAMDAAVIEAPPQPSGCIDAVTPGDHVYTCNGLRVDARIPAVCQKSGCGLILEIHGDTGTGLLMDAHTKLRDLGDQHGYVVFAPTGPPYGQGQPGSTWTAAQDANLIAMTKLFATVFRVDSKKVHATGFSRGGFVAWRLLCDASDLFASVAPAAAGSGNGSGEVTCFASGRAPTRKTDLLFLMGRTDGAVPYTTMVSIRDAAIANYAGGGPQTVASDPNFKHTRWTGPAGVVIETFDHAYETVSDGPWASAKGHCVPGSPMDPYAPQYAVPCKAPNAFMWGQEVMQFFLAHPKK